jgi:2-dehydro-3-deoxyphosphogluconate aldolase/(4S)-4-hydroxy-2-oxoglutarate aldolase
MSVILQRLRELRIVPVIVIDDPEAAVPVAEALVAGGLPCAEVTFRTAAGANALHRIAEALPEVHLGAGTVLSPSQVDAACDAGARFIVAPGFNARVVDRCLELGLPVFPGVCTPTEVEAALEKGLRTLKFFPAEPMGGLPFLKALAAPYGDAEFIPTGGINAGNLGAWLAFPKVVACGGSWMVAPDWIRARDFERVRTETENAVRIARGAARV